jgi:hypothetical protein
VCNTHRSLSVTSTSLATTNTKSHSIWQRIVHNNNNNHHHHHHHHHHHRYNRQYHTDSSTWNASRFGTAAALAVGGALAATSIAVAEQQQQPQPSQPQPSQETPEHATTQPAIDPNAFTDRASEVGYYNRLRDCSQADGMTLKQNAHYLVLLVLVAAVVVARSTDCVVRLHLVAHVQAFWIGHSVNGTCGSLYVRLLMRHLDACFCCLGCA